MPLDPSLKDLPNYIDKGFIEWVLRNKIKNELGKPIEFTDYKFMIQPYADFFPNQVTMKSAQVGWSTESILKSFYLLAIRHLNVIYTLPTVEDVRDFVPAKVDAIIKNNPYLVSLLGDSDAMGKKQLGNNFIFYRGTSGKKAALMHTSDANFYDEYDSCDLGVVDLYTSRLQRSEYKAEMKFSNPTRPGGIDAQYAISDQREWLIKCSRCGLRQPLDYWKNVCQERKIYVCSGCKEELSEEDRVLSGMWVAKYSERSDFLHGYHVNQLMAPWQTAKSLILLEQTKGNDYFYNMVLGLPYVNKDVRVDSEVITRCMRPVVGSRLRNAMGVDVKLKDKHYVLGNRDGIFKVGIAQSWAEIEALIEEFNPICVIDANPDFYPRREMIPKYPGQVFCCIYKENTRKVELIRWLDGDERGMVYVDRNEMLDYTLDQFFKGRVKINIGGKSVIAAASDEYKVYIDHFENLYRVTVEGRLGIERNIWEHKGPDDFAHATNYFHIALSKVPEDAYRPNVLNFDFARLAPEILDGKIPIEQVPDYGERVGADDWKYN